VNKKRADMANEPAILEATRDMRPAEPSAEADQLALFGEFADAMAEDAQASFGVPMAKPKGKGRPKGARNLATRQTVDLIQALGADPLMNAAAIVRGGPAYVMRAALEAWAQAYGCEAERDPEGRPQAKTKDGKLYVPQVMSPKDAFAVVAQCRDLLKRVMHSDAPAEVKHTGIPAVPINISLEAWAKAGADIVGGEAAEADAAAWPAASPDISGTYDEAGEEVTRAESHTPPESDEDARG
jgi:hypothetical protein